MQTEVRSTEVVTQLEVDRLIPHPLNQEIYGDPRTSPDFGELVASIRAFGILEPIIISVEYIVLSGHRRLAAAIDLGMTYVPTRMVAGLSKKEQKELIVTLNQHRKRPTSIIVREAIAIERKEEAGQNGHSVKEEQSSILLATNAGFPTRRIYEQAKKVVLSGDEALISLMDKGTVTHAYRSLHRQQGVPSPFTSLIKPSDNWNFSPVRYPRIDGNKASGYIPGDLYVNCFWYFVKSGDKVVDPMAGSGMARYVYEKRHEWMGEHLYDFDLELFDLTPQAEGICQHDLLKGFPTDHADYIFLDLPYLGMSRNAYSRKKDDLANMNQETYLASVLRIAQVCATVQKPGQLCTVISPNYTDHRKLEVINMAEFVRNCWRSCDYTLYLETYSSRRIQQSQNTGIARLNNIAKEKRLPLTDISVIMTFKRVSAETEVMQSDQ
jgi:hypothetical protein